MPQLHLVPPDDAFAHARFYGFHGAPRPDPLARVAIGGEPATAQLDRTVQRLRTRDELLLTEVVEDRAENPFFRALMIATPIGAMIWIAIGVLIAWAEGRL